MKTTKKKKRWWKVLIIIAAVLFLIILGIYLYISKVIVPGLVAELERTRYESWEEEDGSIYQDIVYDEENELSYTLYIPATADKTTDQGLILFVHGGGWDAGSRGELEFMCRQYAKEGYICATLDYTLIPDDDTSITMETILDDIEHCTGHIVDTAADLGYTITQMATGGESAGGHLSMLYAWSRTQTSPLPVKLIIDICGPTDFHASSWIGQSYVYGSESQISRMVSKNTGVSISYEELENGEAEDAIAAISPLTYINENSCPIILNYGGVDTAVSSVHQELLLEKLEEYHVPYDYFFYPNTGHGLYAEEDTSIYLEYRATAKERLTAYFGY